MSKFIRRERLEQAILRLAAWRNSVQSQASAHLFPLLALLRKKINQNAFQKYEEADDFDFFDTFFRVPGLPKTPYFDPLTRSFRIESHPHSNIATARKGTFERSWQAATSKLEGEDTLWKLSEDFAEKVEEKVFTRSGAIRRLNVLDISAWLFRGSEFADDAKAEQLAAKFRAEFQMSDDVFNRLFEYLPEPEENIFSHERLSDSEQLKLFEKLKIDGKTISKATEKVVEQEKVDPPLPEDDPVAAEVRQILMLGSSGIILRGAPGTSKSWYARQIAAMLTDNDPARLYRVQFHPSYSYEDFIEGFVPDEDSKSGFCVVDRIFLQAVKRAKETDKPVVFVIDELNRGDPARIFGELLTYIEHGWRGTKFRTKLGTADIDIPRNLIVLATMNPHDRSITQLDMALLRRFDHVDISPSPEIASNFLLESGMAPAHASAITTWFTALQKMLPFGIGHAYFLGMGDIGRLNVIWRYRIRPYCESILEFEPERLENIVRSYEALENRLRGIAI